MSSAPRPGTDVAHGGEVSASVPPQEWQLWFDGTSAPNPGRMGLGVVLVAPDGTRTTDGRAPGTSGCNNVAELSALALGLSMAQAAGARQLAVFSDSDFVVRHVSGGAVTHIHPLARLVRETQAQLDAFDTVRFQWIPRHRNGEADHLARAALGLRAKPALRPISRKRRR